MMAPLAVSTTQAVPVSQESESQLQAVPATEREVLRCESCKLVQFRTASDVCRRCKKSLLPEQPKLETTIALVPEPAARSAEGGLQVATAVRDLRHVRNLSQRQLAARMGVPRTYISKIENGKAIPTLGSLERLASALEVDICQLVRDGRSQRDEEVAEIFADPFLAELAEYLPHLDPLQRSLLLNQTRDRARESVREFTLGKRRTA